MTPPPLESWRGGAYAGILLLLGSTALFACLDTGAKYLSATYPILQIAWARYLFQGALLPFIVGRVSYARVLRTRRPGLQIVRSMLLLGATLSFFAAVSVLPLADASAITMVSPLLITIFAIPLLGEQVGRRRWTAVIVGLVGALVIIRPGLGVFDWYAVLPLTSALCYSLYTITTRMLSTVDPPVTTFLYTGLVGALVLTAIVPFVWRAPDLEGWVLMVLLGLFGGGGHYLVIQAYRRAMASVLAPLAFCALIWVTLLGYLVFGDLPDGATVAGALIIVASGVFVFYRERVVKLDEH